MSFLKKIGETMKDTASTIGAKSIDMVETGKLKIQQSQLENVIQSKKFEIGDLIYKAKKQSTQPDEEILSKIIAELTELDNQVSEIDEKLHKESSHAASNASTEPTAVCSKCGEKIPAGVKFCSNCGEPQ